MASKDKPLGLKSGIESKLEDIDIVLSYCNPFGVMFGIKNLSSDLRESYTRNNITITEYGEYINRLDKMIFDSEKKCICKKIK